MYVDALLLFSNAQAVTAAAASTNYVDLGAVRDIGTGQPLYVVSCCTVAMTDSGSDSQLDVILYADSTSTFTPDAQQTLFQFPATSAAGTILISALDPVSAPLQYRYIQLYYSPLNGNLSAGTFTSFMTHNVDRFKAYADNITIS